MSLVYKQPFMKVLREIHGIEQKYIETQYYLYLYETKIVTPVKTFQLKDVLDVSYLHSQNKYSTLYLHTNQGVFAYYVSSHPEEFIRLLKSFQS
uniref:Bacterial Pleckstrin homology domain-containing protein n=1 Tax=Anaerobacillus isosaccharinicus TaxID=1532552 RepID=A0A1S2KUE1_9BACI|nr:hypothetical protein [Anaerobacillus isosaccharinicus]